MFGMWTPVAHVLILQFALAFIYLIWPVLKKMMIIVSRLLPDSWFKSDRHEKIYTRSGQPYRGNWRQAQYQRADDFRRSDWREQRRAQANTQSTPPPLKAQYLRVLGLREPVHMIDVKSAYRRLAKTYHPDRFAAAKYSQAAREAAAEKMREVNAAYDWLCANI
jgi:hypothetical protein